MTCRHGKFDPACSSYEARLKTLKSDYATYITPETPDASHYEIEDIAEIGGNLVLKVRYPNCVKCAYEGNKVMVFLGATTLQAIKWKRIDPHFREPQTHELNKEAPPPAARFPASAAGWADALAYAQTKAAKVMR